MKKRNPSKKDILETLTGLQHNIEIMWQKLLQIDNLFGLYLEHRKETENFSKFVKKKAEEFEQQRPESEK